MTPSSTGNTATDVPLRPGLFSSLRHASPHPHILSVHCPGAMPDKERTGVSGCVLGRHGYPRAVVVADPIDQDVERIDAGLIRLAVDDQSDRAAAIAHRILGQVQRVVFVWPPTSGLGEDSDFDTPGPDISRKPMPANASKISQKVSPRSCWSNSKRSISRNTSSHLASRVGPVSLCDKVEVGKERNAQPPCPP